MTSAFLTGALMLLGAFALAFAQQTQFPTDPNKAKGQLTKPGKK